MTAIRQITGQFSTLSLAAKVGIGVLALAILFALGFGVHWWKGRTIAALTNEQIKLKEENRQAWDDYWEAIGERNALRVQAQQLKLEADAYR